MSIAKDKSKNRRRTGIKEQLKAAKRKAKELKAGKKDSSSSGGGGGGKSDLIKRIKDLEKRVTKLENQNKKLLSIFANTFAQLSNAASAGPIIVQNIPNNIGGGSNNYNNELKGDEKEYEPESESASNNMIPGRKPLKWSFQSDHKVIVQGENGASASKPKYKSGTVRFGKNIPVYKEGDIFQEFNIIFDTQGTGNSSSLGFGIAQNRFSNWVGSNWGDNGCAYMKGNGQFITSDMYTDVDKLGLEQKQVFPDFKQDGWFKEGNDIKISVDMKECVATFTNTVTSKGFKIGFPKTREMMVIIYMGGSAMKKLRIKDQFTT